MDNWENPNALDGIAVIGMAGRFPGAKTPEEFWQNLCQGVESISFFSDETLLQQGVENSLLSNPNYVKANGVLEDIELFDPAFFGMTPREVEVMDPQHRLLLECAWNALENAGYDLQRYQGVVGIYGGGCLSTYLQRNLLSNQELLQFMDFDLVQQQDKITQGNDRDYLMTRISYKLGLTGPSVTVNTVCSTSLVAVHLACQTLLTYQCDMALAGGVSIQVPQIGGYLYKEGGITSPDGHCRAFDHQAQGTIFGNGVGMVLLKRLDEAIADGDHIYGVIKGSAINNDGTLKVSYTAPSVAGQADAIAEAQAIGEVEPETITYIEAHGTGTALGDPIEITALNQVFRASTEKKQFCAIGSVKTNIGHLNRAAGISGLIKTLLALKHQKIPPSLNFEQPNPNIDFDNSPFYVNTTLADWQPPGIPRRAGVSSFGFGGTNAHVVLEESPMTEPSSPSRAWQLLVLSAKTDTALEKASQNLGAYLKAHPDLNLGDVAYTLQVGRRRFAQSRIVVGQGRDGAITALETPDHSPVVKRPATDEPPPVTFMFSGQGSQYPNMGRELYQSEAVFREQIDDCAEGLKPHLGQDIRDIIYPDSDQENQAAEKLKQTAITQPALFIIEYALAKLWQSWGVSPHSLIGHSIGEYVAACLAGVFSLEDALMLVAARGQLMEQLPPGVMLAVPLTPDEIQPLLKAPLSLAVVNGVARCVVSGPREAIEQLVEQLKTQGIEGSLLHTSHAFHSAMMEPILEPFTAKVRGIALNAPQIPYISNVTGTWITPEEATDPTYWAQHLRQTVQFAPGIEQLLQQPEHILLEVGPGRTLSTLAMQHPSKTPEQKILTSVRHPKQKQSDLAFILKSLGQLWQEGVDIDWPGFYAQETRYRVPLPTYAFDKKRYWIEAKAKEAQDFSQQSGQNVIANYLVQGKFEQLEQSLETVEKLSADEVTSQLNSFM
ncbi:type I polyketide synthase [Crocosphaera sp.]|uniref:type I polyketide synthase n=1 Tax=Crocosphaera sp. TaxID=2729996 RepID=UPI003F20BE38|nr:type I polyketide synthase [Crocosphaera sp.]